MRAPRCFGRARTHVPRLSGPLPCTCTPGFLQSLPPQYRRIALHHNPHRKGRGAGGRSSLRPEVDPWVLAWQSWERLCSCADVRVRGGCGIGRALASIGPAAQADSCTVRETASCQGNTFFHSLTPPLPPYTPPSPMQATPGRAPWLACRSRPLPRRRATACCACWAWGTTAACT